MSTNTAIIIILLNLISLLKPSVVSSQNIETQYSSSVSGNKCVKRDIHNYFNMVDMSNSSFENQIRNLGTQIEYGEDFSVLASEQYSRGATFGDCIYTFKKSGNQLVIFWFGEGSQTCFNTLADNLKDHYIETKDNRRIYIVDVGEKKYGVTIERKMLDATTMSEIVSITRLAVKK